MRKLIFMIALMCVSAIGTFAQGTAVTSDVRSTPGPVVPGAQVTICTTASPTTLIPCFPKATIYVDPLLTVQSANPVTADGNGNYSFYAPAGNYVRSITGQGLPGKTDTITIPCAPGSLTCGGSVILGLNNTFTGSNNFAGGFSINSLLGVAASGPLTVGDCTNILSINPPVIGDSGGVCGGGGGGGAFGTLSTGTNSQAAMTVGTGASMGVSGSGTIAATSAPFPGLSGGTNTGAAMVVGSGASLSATGSGVLNANQINGTTIPVNLTADQVLLTAPFAVGLWSSVPVCLDAAGQHLNYNTATHQFSCGTSGGTAGSAAFNTITNGTNASAAMVVGTGSSLGVSGSGTIAATSSPFSGLVGSTNTSAAMVLGTGSSLTISGSGTNNATAVNGTTVPVNSAADQFLGTTASATGAWAAMPSCLDAGGNHINYNTSTHAFSCGTSGGTAGSAAFNTITPGTNTSAAMLVGSGSSLGTTGSGTITATALPFSGLTTSSNTTATLTMGTGAVLTTSGTGQINANLVTGTTVPTNSAADQVLGTTASATGAWLSLPSCLDTVGQHLNYNTSTHSFACGTTSSGGGGGAGTVVASPQFQIGSFPNAGSSATVQGTGGITTDASGNNLNVGGNLAVKGPNPYYDITRYGGRPVSIHTTGTGSGTSLTVGVSTFVTGDGITIVQGGAAPAISAPAGLAVATGAAEGLTTIDVPTAAGMTGASTYNYKVFAVDIYGGATVPTSPVTITNGPATLGKTQFTISSWSLTGNTLTIVTSVSSGLPVGTEVHPTGTSNNALAGGWYPISSISGTTITINNVPQYSATTVAGTGGTITAFVGNALTWTRSTGGTLGTYNVVWDYYVCAQRPGDGAYHIIGRSFPSTFYQSGIGYSSTRFVDFGSPLAANPIIPWYLSDANCTAGSPQNELFTTTVASGGGTTSLTLAVAMPSAVSGVVVRQDNDPAINAASIAAANGGGTNGGGSIYIPVVGSTATFEVNVATVIQIATNIQQGGTLTLNEPLIFQGSTNWTGTPGSTSIPAFGFAGTALTNCNAWPCIWVAGFSNQATGGTTFENLTLTSIQNGLTFLVDANWGMIWKKVNFEPGLNNNDNMGIGLMIRPGAASYAIQDSNFIGGPNQTIDQTWAPLFYADQGISGCCSGAGNVGNIDFQNTQWNRRGIYYLANGGDGAHINIGQRFYRQGGITPMVEVQNINGSIAGNVQMDYVFHDTESQAAYAQICNINCAPGTGVFSSLAFHLGNANTVSQDAGTVPGNVTGGGNAAIQQVVAQSGPGGTSPNLSPGFMYYQGSIVPTAYINTTGLGVQMAIVPNVTTPAVALQNSGFTASVVPGTLGANITLTTPTTSGTLCTTTTCGGGGGGGLADPGGNGLVNRTALNTTAPITTSAGLAAVISDETGSGAAVFGTSPALVTPNVTTILDANANPFIKSSATGSAVDSVTITNAATANPATVIVGASGSDTNINLEFTSKGSGTVILGSPSAYVDSSGNAFFNSWNFSTPGPITMIGPESTGCTGQANQDAIFIGDSTKHAVQINNNNAGCESALALSGSPVATGNIVVGNSAFPDVTDSGIAASSVFTTSSAAVKFLGPGPWIDVTNPTYGADPTGVADSHTAINAAIAACPAHGGVVYFPPGTYLYTGQITLNASCTLMGWNHEAVLKKGYSGNNSILVSASASGILGLELNGNNGSFTGSCIVVGSGSSPTNVRIENNYIHNCDGVSVYLVNAPTFVTVRGNRIIGGAHGESLFAEKGVTDIFIDHNYMDSSIAAGASTLATIRVHATTASIARIQISDNILIVPNPGSTNGFGIEAGNFGGTSVTWTAQDISITHNTISANNQFNACISALQIIGAVITNNTCNGNGFASAIGAWDMELLTGATFANNTANVEVASASKHCGDFFNVNNSTITGNVCNGWGETGGWGFVFGDSTNANTVTTPTSQTGNLVTMTVTATNNQDIFPGSVVYISGVTPAGFNGYYTVVSTPTSTSLTYNTPNTGLTYVSGGTVAGTTSHNVVSANVFNFPLTTSGNTYGIQLQPQGTGEVVNDNLFVGNVCNGNANVTGQTCIIVEGTSGGTANNTFIGTQINDIAHGIERDQGTNDSFLDTVFTNVTQNWAGSAQTGEYIRFLPPNAAPTCTFTSGGGTVPSCALDTGSTNDRGIIIATTGTGSPGSTGTITLTFGANFGINKPVCEYSANDNVTAWANGPVFKDKTPAVGSDLFTWTNIASGTPGALSASSAYWINYQCTAK